VSTIDIAVFGSAQTEPGTPDWQVGVEVGSSLANAGFGVITGGYGGTMEAVSMGAGGSGGRVIGVTAPSLFPDRTGVNPYVTELHEAPTLTARLGLMLHLAAGSIILPGSIGTATELVLAWNVNHIARRHGGESFPAVAVGAQWRRVGAVLTDEIGAVLDDVHWAEDPMAAVDWMVEQMETRP